MDSMMNLINLDDDSSTACSSNKRAKIMQELGDKVETVRISCTLPNRRKSKLDSSNKRNASASSPTGTKKVDQQVFSDMSVRNCLRYCFTFASIQGLSAACCHLNQSIKPLSAATIKAEVWRLHQKMKEQVKFDLEKVSSRICLTVNFWTSCTTTDYLCLSAHYLDEDWKLNVKFLNFSRAPFPNFANDLCDKIYGLLDEWGIGNKIFSLTADNACSMGNMLLCEQLNQQGSLLCQGKFFKIASCADILDLIVEDSLKVIDESVCKIRESVKYVTRSKPVFHQCLDIFGIEGSNGLWLDVPNRWNSTYLMIERALHYQHAFLALKMLDTKYTHCPTSTEWTMLGKTYKILKPFHEMAKLFSGSNYPPSNMYFQRIWNIRLSIEKGIQSCESHIQEMAKEMKGKFDKYWDDYGSVISFAVILDPRLKMQYVKSCLRELGESYAENWVHVYDQLKMLFKDYQNKHPHKDESGDSEFQCIYPGVSDPNKLELDQYLDEPRLDVCSQIDVLSYWKENQDKYTLLARMAKDILSIPITTISSESAFSIGNKVLNRCIKRFPLKDMEAILTTRNWLYGYESYEGEELENVHLIGCEVNYPKMSEYLRWDTGESEEEENEM